MTVQKMPNCSSFPRVRSFTLVKLTQLTLYIYNPLILYSAGKLQFHLLKRYLIKITANMTDVATEDACVADRQLNVQFYSIIYMTGQLWAARFAS